MRAATAAMAIAVAAAMARPALTQTSRPDLARQKDPRYALAWERTARRVPTRFYAIRSDLDHDVTRQLAGHMDRVCQEYGRLLSGLKARRTNQRFRIYLFRTQEAYLATLNLRFDSDAEGTGGMCIRDGTEITLAAWQGNRSVTQLEQVLRHEGFHQYSEIYFPNMPPWADEGLAELFEAAVVLDDGMLLGDVTAGQLSVLREAARRNRLVPFDRFFKMDADDWQDHVNEGRGTLHYAQAWAIVHYLLYGEQGRFLPSFERFLVLMNRGLSWRAAFQQAFGVHDLQPFADRWLAYLRNIETTDFADTIVRLEFLAAGLLQQAETGSEPETLAALQSALTEATFRYRSSRFGVERRLSADDGSVFRPGGERESAVFVLRENPRAGRSRSADAPLIPKRAVFTKGLPILDLGVVWTLDKAGEERRWQLVSERAGRR